LRCTNGSQGVEPQERGRILRLHCRDRASFAVFLDGVPLEARDGDTVLTAILTSRGALRRTEWRNEPRAGFCLMGACQDCWIWGEDGSRVRACSTPAVAGQRLLSHSPLSMELHRGALHT